LEREIMNSESAVITRAEAVGEAEAEIVDEELLVESLIEDISIDGMCGVY
jgi:mycofactocin precursor